MSVSNMRRWRSFTCVVPGLLALCAAGTATTVFAAVPSSGSVSIGSPINWNSSGTFAPNPLNGCSDPTPCDNFDLTIVPPVSGDYLVTITLTPLGGDDWDLEVYDPGGGQAGSSGNAPGALEVVTLANPASGVWRVAANPFAGAVSYTANATMVENTSGGGGLGNEKVEFYVYKDPANHEGGEPSGGVNWQSEPADGTIGGDNGGSIMFVSSLTTLRVQHDDCMAPAEYLAGGAWADISVPTHVTSLDPIGLVDPITGRMFSDQLAVKSSLLGLSDDDGATWLPSQGAPLNPGVDHQTLGAGRLAEPLYSQLDGDNPLYNNFAHGVYYASQDIALAQAGVSVDGGQTFGSANPMYNLTQCSGLHGHAKVSPVDGTVYVPNKSCSGEQGVAISENNALTWTVRTVPGSGSGEWDPSVSVGSDGTLYMGMDRGGRPLTAVSTDKGQTWSALVNVAPNVRTTAFSTMIAGDGDRAAYMFLGTDTPSSLGTDQNNRARWDVYISMTFDRGVTWNTTNVTEGGSPVQRGVICDQGTTCPSNRNLLDFNDLQVDKRGRPIAFFAYGCTGACSDPGSSVVTQNRQAAIARLKSPKGLFAIFDAERSGQPDWPNTTVVDDSGDALVKWQEPGDGGNDIASYEVRRDDVVIATLPASVRSYTDPGMGTSTSVYKVLAQNSNGYSRLKASCDNGRIPGVDPGPNLGDPCDFAGKQVLRDGSGDIVTAGNPLAAELGAFDMTRLGISQNEDIHGAGNIAFVLDVQNTDDIPPNSYWPIQFKDSNGADMFVRMDTQAVTPNFTYGSGTDVSPTTNPGTQAEAESQAANGKIIIVIPMTATSSTPGSTLSMFQIRARQNLVAVTITPDNMPDALDSPEGSYTVVDAPVYCATNVAPTLMPDFANTEACTPVLVDVLSNDSDADGDMLLITGVSGATNGVAVQINDGGVEKIEYRPNAGYSGVETLTYTVDDGNGHQVSATITITVSSSDIDGDGVLDGCDNCSAVANADQLDDDDDLVGSACDNCTYVANGPNEVENGDLLVSQCDSNGDGFGNACDPDLNNNNVVNFVDLGMLRSVFQTADPDADLSCNGVVNFVDLGIMKSLFLGAPGPSAAAP